MKKKELFYVIDNKNIGKILKRLTRKLKVGKKVYKNGLVGGLSELEVKIYRPGKPLLKVKRR